MEAQLSIINQYFYAFNRFDVDGMAGLLHQKFRFFLFQDEVLNMEIKGIEEFKSLAKHAQNYLSHREQTIVSVKEVKLGIEVRTVYKAIFAVDLPHGQHAGQSTTRESRTIFTIKDDKILEMREYA
jgi:ketosteroid isomerase-like protein